MTPSDRGAETAPQDFFGDSSNKITYLEQNWSAADSLWFYNTTQGSNLIEYEVFLNIEQPNSQELFRSNENMRRYRNLIQRPTRYNPDGLPVGFAKDSFRGVDYLGLTCAACHTGQINYQGVGIRIDGGPTISKMLAFQQGLLDALEASLNSEEKLTRLAQRIYKKSTPDTLVKLKALLEQRYNQHKTYVELNTPTHGEQIITHGYGRMDAFGSIYNRVLNHLTPDDPSNSHPPNAPVSLPFLWDTPAHDFVQWNGIGDNYKAGALGRNVGEVLGVFGTMELKKREGDKGLRSSLNIHNIVRLERRLVKLWSPEWPEDILPQIDRTLAEKGRQVFIDYHCHDCHRAIDRRDPDRLIIAQMASLDIIETDPAMAINALSRTGKGGYFVGMDVPFTDDGSKIQEVGPVLPLVQIASEGAVIQPDEDQLPIWRNIIRLWDILFSIKTNPVKNDVRQVNFKGEKNPEIYLKAYKARPLNGIWATAPYLHNGAVPSLYDLFLPSCSDEEIDQGQKCRPNSFTVGSREFDPVKVGLISRDAEKYPQLFVMNTNLPGNSNRGHEYAVGKSKLIKLDGDNRPLKNPDGSPLTYTLPPISEEQRMALVEYLKTL